jgi:intein/homing endonuclease
MCNDQSPEAIDCWDKTRFYLEGEVLLEWDNQIKDDKCPKCNKTRTELLAGGLFKGYDTLHAVVGMRCVALDTRVRTKTGFIKIGDLLPANPQIDVFSKINGVEVYGEHGWEPASDVYYAGQIDSVHTTFSNGMELISSKVHPLYGCHNGKWGWHKISRYVAGDYIEARLGEWPIGSIEFTQEVKNKILLAEKRKNYECNFILPTQWSPELASILGYLISEGSVTYEYICKFTNGDQCTLDHFSSLCKAVFDKHAVLYKDITVELAGAAIRDTLAALGLCFNTAHDKSVPSELWAAPEDCVTAFLRAYFEGDGTAAVEKNNRGRQHAKPAVACYTVSKRLALDIQQLLWNLGIDASISATKSRRFGSKGEKFKHDAYSVRLYGNNIKIYSDKIGFNSDRKKTALQKCVSVINGTKCNEHFIPCVADIATDVLISNSVTPPVFRSLYGLLSNRYKSISYSKLRALNADISYSNNTLNRLLRPESRFIKIKSIENGPSVPMADLHVPGTHSFVADSILNHNSGKTATSSMIATYIEHRIITMHHATKGGIARVFQQLPNQAFEMAFVASSDVQSQDTVWAHFIGRRRQSPWLQRYIQWLKHCEKSTPLMSGVKIIEYVEKEKEIDNAHLNLTMISLNSNCFVGTTHVILPGNTWKILKSLQVGDEVVDKDGNTQVVEAIIKEPAPPFMMQVITSTGIKFIVTGNHAFPVVPGNTFRPNKNAIVRTMACDIKVGDYLLKPTSLYKHTIGLEGVYQDKDYAYIPVEKISVIRSSCEYVYNLTVSNDHSYLVQSGIATYNSSGMAGRTRISAIIDELSRFQISDSRLSADEAYRVLENSLLTVRSAAKRLHLPQYFGSMVSISSPISAEDKSMRLLKQAGELKHMLAYHYPTWQFNPFEPRENFDEYYIKDPLGSERDFGANPPAASNPLIDDPDRFRKAAIDVNLSPTIELNYYDKPDKVGNLYKAAQIKEAQLRINYDCSIVFDAGLTFDTFAGAAAHGEWMDMPGMDDPVWVTVFDWVLRVVPQVHPTRKDVWFESVIDIIQILRQKHRILQVEFDRWNSAQLVQSIREMGIMANQKGTTVQDFLKFVADAYTSKVRMLPPDQDMQHTSPEYLSGICASYYELERLERSPDLRRVFNPNKGQRRGWNSDDVAQCIVHCHRLVQEQVSGAHTGSIRSIQTVMKNEQASGAMWGTNNSGRIFHPTSGTRRW